MNMEINKMISIPSDIIRISVNKKNDIETNFRSPCSIFQSSMKLPAKKNNVNKILTDKKINFYALNDQDRKEDEIYQKKNFNSIKINSIIQNLNYDKRIKFMKRDEDQILLYFWNIQESISFYKQYFMNLDMKFGEKKPFENDRRVWRDFSLCSDTSLSFLRLKLMNIEPPIKEEPEHKKPGKEQKFQFNLNDRIIYFGNLAKFYSINDLKYLQLTLSERWHEIIYDNTRELAVGIASNVIFQDIINRLDQQGLESLVDNLNYDLAPMCSTKYGAYSIQNLLMLLKNTTAIEKVKKYFKPFIIDLCKHPIGNYTVQKILKLEKNYIFDHMKENFLEIITDDLAYKVLKSCLESFTDKYETIKELINVNSNDIEVKKKNEMIQLLSKK